MSEDSALQAFADDVREAMRDYPQLNKLIDGEEHKDKDRKKALEQALEQVNLTPPLTDYTFATCPFRTALIDLAIARLLRTLLYLLERNEMDASDGGGVVARKKQIDLIRSTIQEIRGAVIPELRETKKAVALHEAIGVSGSIYSDYYGNNW